MKLINSIKLDDFKSFKSQNIDFSQLTVLTGLNNSGKSSVLQAIRMYFSADDGASPYIDGFGGYSDLKSNLSEISSPIKFELFNEIGQSGNLVISNKEYKIKNEISKPFMQYVSADRYGPRVSLPLMSDKMASLTVGHLGQYAAHYAQIFENTIVAQDLRNLESASHTLKHQLVAWMREISPGVKLDFDVAKRYDTSSLGVDGYRSTNSGYGISYTLPIVLCLLTMTGNLGGDDSEERLIPWFKKIHEDGGLLLVENPEAHLHPRGQTNMGRLIALAAGCGLQIIVETHSDHLLDGIRLAIKNNPKIKGSAVNIKYFSKNESEESSIERITLKDDGKIEKWPSGFFDQFSINLRALSSKNG